jgi:hypothetical protein
MIFRHRSFHSGIMASCSGVSFSTYLTLFTEVAGMAGFLCVCGKHMQIFDLQHARIGLGFYDRIRGMRLGGDRRRTWDKEVSLILGEVTDYTASRDLGERFAGLCGFTRDKADGFAIRKPNRWHRRLRGA